MWAAHLYALSVLAFGTHAQVLDTAELESAQYSINILDSPVMESGQQDGSSALTVVNKFGQRYTCSLPEFEEKAEEDAKREEEEIPDVESLLAPLMDQPCIFRTKDWWTYEVCFGKVIKQYHIENDKPVGNILHLGQYAPDQPEDTSDPGSSTKRYHSHLYSNGTKCDLTGKPRKTELRFICDESVMQEFLVDIFEPQSCEYVIMVHTNKICSVPHLRPLQESVPLPINCNPLLTSSQMEQFEVYKKKKAEAAELLKVKNERLERERLLEKLKMSESDAKDLSLEKLQSLMGDKLAEQLVAELNNMLDTSKPSKIKPGVNVIDLDFSTKRDPDKTAAEKSEKLKEESSKAESDKSSKSEDGQWELVSGPDSKKSQHDSDSEAVGILRDSLKQLNSVVDGIKDKKNKLDAFKERVKSMEARQDGVLAELYDTKSKSQKDNSDKKDPLDLSEEDLNVDDALKLMDSYMKSMSPSERQRLAKYRDVIKDAVKDDLSELVEQTKKELGLTDDDTPSNLEDQVSKSLDNLMEKMNRLNSQINQRQDPPGEGDRLQNGFKHDGKRSVKKDLSRLEEQMADQEQPVGREPYEGSDAATVKSFTNEQQPDVGGGKSDDLLAKEKLSPSANEELTKFNSINKKLLSQLDELEKKLSSAVTDLKDLEHQEKFLVKKLEGAKEQQQQTGKTSKLKVREIHVPASNDKNGLIKNDKEESSMGKKLEASLKDKLEELGFDNDGKQIEVKVITTQLPSDGEGDTEGENSQQFQQMIYNIFTGNQAAADDINNQRSVERNYKFSWSDDMIGDVESRLEKLSMEIQADDDKGEDHGDGDEKESFGSENTSQEDMDTVAIKDEL